MAELNASAYNAPAPQRLHHDIIVIEFASDHCLIPGILLACSDFVTRDTGRTSPNLEVVLRELLSNAIEHGNRNVRSRRVRCELMRLSRNEVGIRVSDQGSGFAHHDLDTSAPKAPGSRLHRGLALVRAFCDEVSFNTAGNEVSVRLTWDELAATDKAC